MYILDSYVTDFAYTKWVRVLTGPVKTVRKRYCYHKKPSWDTIDKIFLQRFLAMVQNEGRAGFMPLANSLVPGEHKQPQQKFELGLLILFSLLETIKSLCIFIKCKYRFQEEMDSCVCVCVWGGLTSLKSIQSVYSQSCKKSSCVRRLLWHFLQLVRYELLHVLSYFKMGTRELGIGFWEQELFTRS